MMKINNRNICHICNLLSDELNIYNINKLNNIIENGSSIYLINIHLNWEGRKLSSNYGFDVANILRTEKKSKSPIIFYSPIPKEYFEKLSKKEIKYKILFGRGSAFIEIPISENKLLELVETLHPLSNATLHDVSTMLCDLKGIVIDKLNHDLKFESNVDEVISKVRPYLSDLQKQQIELEKNVSALKGCIVAKDFDGFNNKKLQFISLCNFELTSEGKNKPSSKRTKHHILLVDDVQEELDKAKSFLADDFTIIETTSGEEAISLLKSDIKNEIVAVISDWRFFTDSNQNYWQSYQGYEVLEFAARSGLRKLYALTSQADFLVHQIRNLMGIHFSMFKKENLRNADQWKVLSDLLYESCEQAVQLRSLIPSSENWTKSVNTGRKVVYKSLHHQYIEKWNSENRDIYFKNVDEICNDIWSYLEEERKSKYKNVYTLKSKYDMTLSPTKPELFPVLVFRRIWMSLWYSRNGTGKLSRDSITDSLEFCYEVMFTGMSKGYKSNSPGVEMNKLCLLTNELLSMKMLPEEREWLVKQNIL